MRFAITSSGLTCCISYTSSNHKNRCRPFARWHQICDQQTARLVVGMVLMSWMDCFKPCRLQSGLQRRLCVSWNRAGQPFIPWLAGGNDEKSGSALWSPKLGHFIKQYIYRFRFFVFTWFTRIWWSMGVGFQSQHTLGCFQSPQWNLKIYFLDACVHRCWYKHNWSLRLTSVTRWAVAQKLV